MVLSPLFQTYLGGDSPVIFDLADCVDLTSTVFQLHRADTLSLCCFITYSTGF